MKRLTLFCVLAVALFWWVAAEWRGATRDTPRLQAMLRNHAWWGEELVWRYAGPRPGNGEWLMFSGRRATHDPAAKFQLVAYLVPKGSNPNGAPWKKLETKNQDIFEIHRVYLPPWDANKDLYLGVQYTPAHPIWTEFGAWPSARLEPMPWVRKKAKEGFTRDLRAYSGPIDARIVKEVGEAVPLPLDRLFRVRLSVFLFIVLILAGGILLPGSRTLWACWCAYQVALMLHVAALLWSSQYLWIGLYYDRIGHRAVWWGVAIVQVLTLPVVLVGLRRLMAPAVVWAARRVTPRKNLVALAAILIPAVAAFWLYPCKAVYGDTFHSLASPFADRHNPMLSAGYHVFRDVVTWAFARGWFPASWQNPIGYDLTTAPYYLILFGPVWILGCWGVASVLGRGLRERWLMFLLLLTCKPLLVHFSYIEAYGPSAAILMVALWLLFRAWVRKSDVVLPSVGAFFGYIWNFGSGPLLPLVAMLWLQRAVQHRFRPVYLLPRLFATGAVALLIVFATAAAILVCKYDGDGLYFYSSNPGLGLQWLRGPGKLQYGSSMLHWFATDYWQPYPIFTWKHFSDWVGEQFFLQGAVFLLAPVLIARGIDLWTRRLFGWALVLSIGVYLAASVVIYNVFPYPQDWDMLTLQAYFHLAALLALVARAAIAPRNCARWLLPAILIYQVWDTGMWLVYNLNGWK